MIQYRNFSNATFGIFEVIETGDLQTLQQRFDEIHQENQGAPINIKKTSKGKLPSEYIILKHGVYRLADHWNNVGNCFWLLNCTESTQVSQKKLCLAYCAYENMEQTFIVFNNILSGTYENDRLLEIVHKTATTRKKQSSHEKMIEVQP
jgi:6-pyruvoyl-tetrahydropterin synthase